MGRDGFIRLRAAAQDSRCHAQAGRVVWGNWPYHTARTDVILTPEREGRPDTSDTDVRPPRVGDDYLGLVRVGRSVLSSSNAWLTYCRVISFRHASPKSVLSIGLEGL